MVKVIALTLLLLATSAAAREKPLRPDVERFKKHAELCEHLAGEWDSDLSKQRQKQIEDGVVKNCGTAQKELQRLRKKYRHDVAATAEIEASANSSVVEYMK
jgi:hypothetical protein